MTGASLAVAVTVCVSSPGAAGPDLNTSMESLAFAGIKVEARPDNEDGLAGKAYADNPRGLGKNMRLPQEKIGEPGLIRLMCEQRDQHKASGVSMHVKK